MNKYFDIPRLIQLRQTFHMNPEPAFEEFKTQQTVKEYLLSIGVSDNAIKSCAKTGLVVDIKGKGKPIEGPDKIVAFRADMDGLRMAENNPHLPYKSITNAAHMCGHDGHMACLLGGISLLQEIIYQLPENRIARFLFQPAEEGCGGAIAMVKENCMDGVSEVWGFHNIPWEPIGKIFVKPGTMMAGIKLVVITVEGKGGHSSLKEELRDPVFPVCEFAVEAEKILTTEFSEWNNKEIIFSLPQIESSKSSNVFPDKARILGSIRYFNDEVYEKFLARLNDLTTVIADKRKVKVSLETPTSGPLVTNNEKLADILKKLFEERVTDRDLPIKASEDFSEFALKAPGCFFFVGIGCQAGQTLHVDNYNFNDECIEDISKIWIKLIKHRLDCHDK